MEASNPVSWYETSLPSHERKRRGHFSTPPQLIEQLLDACGYHAEQDLSQLRVLDPACGSGNFLIAATRRLLAFGRRTGLDDDALATLVQRNIWGFDPDPVACFLAEMQLQTTFAQERINRSSITDSSVLKAGQEQTAQSITLSHHNNILHYLHVHQADGLAFPWEQCENVDLFLANPPYLAAKNTDLSGYTSARQRGQADSYLLFLRLALQVVRPNGWISLVLPDPLLARASASIERQLLLAKTTIHHLWHLSDVFSAYVGAVVIIAQKCSPSSNHQIYWKREQWQQPKAQRSEKKAIRKSKEKRFADLISYDGTQTVSQSLLRSQPRAELRYLLSQVQGTLVADLHACYQQVRQSDKPSPLAPLAACVLIRRGEEISKQSPLLSRINATAHLEQLADRLWYPVLRGGVDVRLYRISVAKWWMHRDTIKKPLERYLAPKILVVKSAGRLQAALDLHGYVALQTLYQLQLRLDRPLLCIEERRDGITDAQHDENDLYFLLALLNSRLLQQYVYVLHTAYKWVQPQIEQHVLTHLPIPTIATMMQKEQIVQRSRLLMTTCDELEPVVELKTESEELYAEQEQAICALYVDAIQQLLTMNCC
jgi:type I restriction-modification system DNA methylase subunit